MKRPVFRRHERTLFTLLAAALPRWRDALLLVKPETVLRWHREGFRLLWRWKSRPKKSPAPRISSDAIELIQGMATENRLWGAERVRGELIKLGIHVAKRTVRRESLDHVVVLGERHLSQVLKDYCFRYFDTARPHQGLEQPVPTLRVIRRRTDPAGVIAIPVLGGLHHDCRAAA